MSLKLMVERRAIPGNQRALTRLLKELRSKAVLQPGFIDGETVVDAFSPTIFMTISTWANITAWQEWEKDPERLEIVARIDELLGTRPVVRLWHAGSDVPPAAV